MKRFTITATALLLSTGAYAASSVQSVEVEADLTAVQNAEAAQVWGNLSADLEAEIAERLVSRIDDEGATVEVDIDEIELANMFTQTIGTADSKLVGDVEIDAPGLFNKMDYTLTVSAEQAMAYYPSGTTPGEVLVDSQVYYDAMLDAFADNIASKFDS
ncbi:hypothetical protein [uncultured Roseobacter sp.]|uniref:hypothetical protein n=1 Tax=uncultured Roseobacter sp. TaxID=114847 RepID=UPI002634CB99|nr:hypothetical protein [uncultured Roseobacter sp.]